jgi:RNA-splicing ligase RtcB
MYVAAAPHTALSPKKGWQALKPLLVCHASSRLMLLAVQVGSYVTRGKGNAQSWSSSSHGAGRKLSRTKAMGTIAQVHT